MCVCFFSFSFIFQKHIDFVYVNIHSLGQVKFNCCFEAVFYSIIIFFFNFFFNNNFFYLIEMNVIFLMLNVSTIVFFACVCVYFCVAESQYVKGVCVWVCNWIMKKKWFTNFLFVLEKRFLFNTFWRIIYQNSQKSHSFHSIFNFKWVIFKHP